MKRLIVGIAITTLMAPLHFLPGCGSEDDNKPTGDAGLDGRGTVDGGPRLDCKPATGAACTTGADCCTSNCNDQTHTCGNAFGKCTEPLGACTNNNECCTFSCVGGKCDSKHCAADNTACAADADCCGQKCTNGSCVPLNTTAKTSGNPCTTNAECASKFCSGGICQQGASFCTQSGDACATDADCCGGLCTKAAGANLGLCGVVAAAGAGGCTPAGQICDNPTTGGTLKPCGGTCCSKSCRPYAPSGLDICQPPSGCHPTGELCTKDLDCCGAIGMPGSTKLGGGGQDVDTHCEIAPGATIGRCDQGHACSPAGSICRLAAFSCDATDVCCSGTVQQVKINCQQDRLGIPRCMIADNYDCATKGPPPAGTACASSSDCCGSPCVPNPSGSPPFVCSTACVPAAGGCTTTADCCAGEPCNIAAGASKGTCGQAATPPPAPPPPPPPGAPPPPPPPPPPPGSTTCAQYGQNCTATADCCQDSTIPIPCSGGVCQFPPPK